MEEAIMDEVREFAVKLSAVFDGVNADLVTQAVAFYMASYIVLACEDQKDVKPLEWASVFAGQFLDNVKNISKVINNGKATENHE